MKRAIVSLSKPRAARYSRARAASGDSLSRRLKELRCFHVDLCEYLIAAPLNFILARKGYAGLTRQRFTAWTKVAFSRSMTNEITSPPRPQPKQRHVPRSGKTKNEGVFSS